MKRTIFHNFISLAGAGAIFLSVGVNAQSAMDDGAMIAVGSTVSIEFTIYLEDGSIFGGNQGGDPLVYEQGGGQLPPGLESALVGLKADDRKKVTLAPEEAYGPINPEAYVDVEIDRIPEDARSVGSVLVVSNPNGNRRYVKVHEVKDDVIIIDLNHPLAGQVVTFDVRVLTVN